jgi:hypothetical protein
MERSELGLVAAGLEAGQPVLDVTRPPPDFASADAARAGEVTAACAAIQRRARFEAGDVEHVSNGQELISMG